jgi:predicted MPP superfamily phosphohydrolase
MKIFYDIIIYGILFLTALLAVILLFHGTKDNKSWEYKNKKINFSIILILLSVFFIIFWGSFIEPRILVIKKEKIDLKNINETIKIAFISDLHIGIYKNDVFLKFLVDEIIKQKPDLVLIGGDIIDNNIKNEIDFLYPLENLSQKIPVYAIIGNHEYGMGFENGKIIKGKANEEELIEYLKKININYLENDLYKIKIKESPFYLFGGDEFWAEKTNFDVLKKRDEDIATVAMIHNPAILLEDYYPHDIDLSLFGHTHGGQIRLVFLGPIGKVDNVLPKNMYKGFIEKQGENKIFVSSGVGETGVRARLFNPPELVIFELY